MSNDKDAPSSDERDLVELFDTQQDRAPESLDRFILDAAKDAVSQTDTTSDRQTGPGIKGWFAIAATLLLGVTITPLLLQSPESALKSTTSSVESVLEVQDNQISADSAAAHEQAGIVAASPMVSAIRAPSPMAKSERSELTEKRGMQDEPLYRQSALDWVKEIRRLMDDKNPDKAQTEYDLFRKAYPEYEPDFQLDNR